MKAVDEVVNRKRKADKMISSPSSVKTCSSGSVSTGGGFKPGTLPPDPAGDYQSFKAKKRHPSNHLP